MLGTALVGVALARSLASEASPPRQVERKVIGHIARVRPAGLGDWKRAARDWIQAARLWSRRDIARALSACYAADRALKSTTFSDAKGTLTSMLLCMLVPRAT
jgi:DNA polymerase III delta subunit